MEKGKKEKRKENQWCKYNQSKNEEVNEEEEEEVKERKKERKKEEMGKDTHI